MPRDERGGTLRPSENAIALIKRFEGFRAESYQDPCGIWTVGYGTTKGAEPGQVVTEARAESLLRTELAHVAGVLNANLRAAVSQNQFDALCSWAYNVGCGNAAKSTLLEFVNAGDTQSAAFQFARWNRAGGIELPGLTRRRAAERQLFETSEEA